MDEYNNNNDMNQDRNYHQDSSQDAGESDSFVPSDGAYYEQSAYNQYDNPQNNTQYGDGRQDRYSYTGSDYQGFGNYGRQDDAYSDARYTADNMGNHGKRPRKKSGFRKILGVAGCAVIFGLVAGVTMIGVDTFRDSVSSSTQEKIETTKSSDTDKSSDSSSGSTSTADITAVVDEVMPSVVSITSTIQSTSYFGLTQESQGAGSGFIIAKTDEKLMIATNNHVVSDSTELTVGFVDGKTASAEIVGTDSYGDLAVISVKLSDVEEETQSQIKVAVMGDSDDLKVGQTVIAIGNALGYGQSVTTGVISAKDREVSLTDGTMTLIQTDAAINPGNSGGVLINLDGEVIGINNAKLADTDVEGMGYAIPISTAQTTLEDIMNAGSIEEEDMAYLGIVGKTIDSTYSEALGIPSGAYVTQVVEDSPAEEAGISAGDVITKLDDSDISSMEGLKGKLELKKAGTEVTLTIKRANQNGEYKEKELKVTLGKKGDYADAIEDTETSEDQSQSSGNSGSSNGNGSDNGSSGYTNPYEYFFGSGNSSGGYEYYYQN